MKSLSLRLLLYVVVLGAGMGAAFGAGIAYGKLTTPASTAEATRSASADQPASAQLKQGPAGAMSTGQAAGGNAREAMGATMTARPVITGTVETVDIDVVTVASGQGQPTKVAVGQRTAIQKTGAIAELKKGDRIAVIGQRGADGAVNAAIIQMLP